MMESLFDKPGEKMNCVENKWKCAGLDCVVVFVRGSHRCGYVRVPENNPAYKLGYDDIPVSVHGGLTFASENLMGVDKSGWWVGFDCAHSGDKILLMPGFSEREEHFWTLDEVVEETEKLAIQLKGLTWGEIVRAKLEYMPEWFKERIEIKEVKKRK